MSEKNGTRIWVLFFWITAFFIGGALWWTYGKQDWKFLQQSENSDSGEEQTKTTQNPSKLLTFQEVENVPEGVFLYGGSPTFAPIRSIVDSTIQKVWSKFQLRYTDPNIGNPGSGTGIRMLLENRISFSQSSRPLHEEEYRQAQLKGFTLKQIPIAIDDIAIAVHPNLNIKGLTVTEIKDIYTGKITNWSQLGGPDLPVVPYSLNPEESGTGYFFQENLLGKEKFSNSVFFVPNTTIGIRKVASELGGIYYASVAEVVPQCTIKTLPIGRSPDNFIPPYQEPLITSSQCPQQRNQLNMSAFHRGEYPLTRRLFIIVKQNGSIEEQAGMAYTKMLLTAQGQKLIEEAGFISLYPVDPKKEN